MRLVPAQTLTLGAGALAQGTSFYLDCLALLFRYPYYDEPVE